VLHPYQIWVLFDRVPLPIQIGILNAIILRIAAVILPNFKINGWITAVKAAIILMFVQLLLNLVFGF
jgi:uncharacterized membrane protein YvlD (DUF360 family)